MTRNRLTKGQTWMLGAAAVVMIGVGGFGAWGTFSNAVSEFHRAATAAGVVAAGEGLTLVLALTMLGLTMLGQAAPAVVRVGLWLAPVSACFTGLSIADTATEAVVYAVTPLAMSGSAEGLGLIARRIVIHTTGVDAEALRRNADAVQRLAFQRAVADQHPDEDVRGSALRKSWTLAERVGRGDTELGAGFVEVQRVRLREGADAALSGMYGAAVPARKPTTPDRHSAQAALRRKFATMDPVDSIRIAHDAHPDMPSSELASLLVSYGVVVDAVQVALIVGTQPPGYEVQRPDVADAQQVSQLPPLDLQGAIEEAASILGPNARAREIADRLREERRLIVTEPYIRTALSRATKKQRGDSESDEMRGGYA